MEHSFLSESWGNLAREEKGKEENIDLPPRYEEDIKIFEKIEKLSHAPPKEAPDDIKELIPEYFDAVLQSVQNYNESILDFDEGKKWDIDREDMNRLDNVRKTTHDGLISNLDTLTFFFEKAGLDKSWRSSVGLHRSEVQRWAQNVMLYLQKSHS